MSEESNQTNETPETVINIGGAPLQESGSCLLEEPLDPCAIVIIGACGDLTRRKIILALFRLFKSGGLPDPFLIVGADFNDMTTEVYRDFIEESIQTLTGESLKQKDWDPFVSRLHYTVINPEADSPYDEVADFLKREARDSDLPGNRLLYLAVPPSQYINIIGNLGRAGFAAEDENWGGWSRVIIEKPFGRDLQSAQDLNRHIQEYFQEDQIYRIDHYLAKETVQNLLMFRFANAIFEPI